MKLPRRQFLHLAAGSAALPVLSRIALAQAYPTRPLRMVIPIVFGMSSDPIKLGLATSFNRPGAKRDRAQSKRATRRDLRRCRETDCLAGHVRLELRNVAANYPVESSIDFRESSRIPATIRA